VIGRSTMSRPDIVDKSKASAHPLRPGRFYTARIKKVNTDGRVIVFIQELGLSMGPMLALNSNDDTPYEVGEYVKCAFTDEFFNELIIFGSVTKKTMPYVLLSTFDTAWKEYVPTISQLGVPDIAKTVDYSRYSLIARTLTWNCKMTVTEDSAGMGEIVITLPEISIAPAPTVIGNAVLFVPGNTYPCVALVNGLQADNLSFRGSAGGILGESPAVNLSNGHVLTFSVCYEVGS